MDIESERANAKECQRACMYNINDMYEDVLGYSYTKKDKSCVCTNGEKDEGGEGTRTCSFGEKTSKKIFSVLDSDFIA